MFYLLNTMMNLKSIKYLISATLLWFCFSSCVQSDYTKLVKSELAKGIRKDSLLFGVKFGNSRDEFFGKCFDLNRQHLVTEGPGNASVQYLFTDSLFHEQPAQIRLLFMPKYDQADKINEMNLEFAYVAWAPWNKQYQSDILKEKVMKIIMHWYKGNEFVTAKIDQDEIPVKLDGNRRILVFVQSEQHVLVKIQDILHPAFKHNL
jgi:hypothetical protein